MAGVRWWPSMLRVPYRRRAYPLLRTCKNNERAGSTPGCPSRSIAPSWRYMPGPETTLMTCRMVPLSLILLMAGSSPGPAAAAPQATLHCESNGKLLQLAVRVHGSRPLRFTFDSGARSTVIDSAAARRLGLKLVGGDREWGVGHGT